MKERYARVRYEDTEQGEFYVIEIQDEYGEWGLNSAYEFKASADNPMGDNNYLSFHIVKRIAQLTLLGYRIIYWI